MYTSAFMWYKLCIFEPMMNRSSVKEGSVEEESENRLASKKEGNITGRKKCCRYKM